MGLFAFNRARRQAQEASQPDAPADDAAPAAQEAAQPDAPDTTAEDQPVKPATTKSKAK